MISIAVHDSNAQRVVLEGSAAGIPAITERWTVSADAIANDPGLLPQVRDELYARIAQKLDTWNAVKTAIERL